jgi:pimeloyl-ACP methyl ester carboxylesterase
MDEMRQQLEGNSMPLVSVGDYELSYSFNGVDAREDGLSVVLVHGAGGQELDWPMAWRSANDMTRLMGLTPKSHGGELDNFPIYAVDLPGHGKSGGTSHNTVEAYSEAVARFLDAMDLEKVLLVGHSMGAAISLTLGVEHNQRLVGIALIGGSSRLVVSDAILDGLQNAFEPTVDNIVKYSWYKNTGAFFKQKGRQRMLDAGSAVVYDDFLACSRFNLSQRLEEVDVPVLVVASDHDRMVPLDKSRKMAETFKHGTFVGLENCGHFQHIEQTSRVAEELSGFLLGDLSR